MEYSNNIDLDLNALPRDKEFSFDLNEVPDLELDDIDVDMCSERSRDVQESILRNEDCEGERGDHEGEREDSIIDLTLNRFNEDTENHAAIDLGQ